MTPRFQKVSLLAHITFSVGWFGAVVPYLALAITGLASQDAQVIRGAYPLMALIGWFVIVPLGFAALLSGLVQSSGTRWGLFWHWWVLVKFVLTIIAVIVLLRHMQEVSRVAQIAAEATQFGADFRTLQIQLLVHPAGGLLVLFAAMTLSVFKPWGLTLYGRNRVSQSDLPTRRSGDTLVREPVFATNKPRWARIIGIHAVVLVVLLAIRHITGLHHP